MLFSSNGRYNGCTVKFTVPGVKANMGGGADNRRKPALAQSRSHTDTLGYEFYSGGVMDSIHGH